MPARYAMRDAMRVCAAVYIDVYADAASATYASAHALIRC